jgi:hypothetical protein
MTLPSVLVDQRPQNRLPALSSFVQPLPAWAESLVPLAVAAASREHAATLEQVSALEHAHRVARDEVQRSDAIDRQAAKAAVAASQQVPPSTAPAAAARLRNAARAIEAGEEFARGTQQRYITALAEHRNEISGAIERETAALCAEAEPLGNEVQAAVLRRMHLANFASAIAEVSPGARLQSFALPPIRRPSRELQRLLETIKENITGRRG